MIQLTDIPNLKTDRLTLRLPAPEDFEAFATFCVSDRSIWVGGPATRDEAHEIFDSYIADWARKQPSYFHIARSDTGAPVGRAGIRHLDHRPEPEVAYSIYDETNEGNGYATEAAIAVRDWAYDALHLKSVVSYVDPANHKSAAVARRMGATVDKHAPGWKKYPDLDIYRHIAPEDRS